MDFSKWTTDAIDIINTKVKINQKFELKSLFEGCEWKKLSKGERINFGKYFANEVRDGKIKNVVAVERGRDNHSKYIKQHWRILKNETINLRNVRKHRTY